ncbi:MAG: glutamate racemase [Clostridia bacterium]|nr:glutamate racemase [Clostridia bacterium]
MDNRRIAIFDSGLGGLTVAKYLVEKMPNEKIIYFGDTARTPYGSKDVETIRKFTIQICDFLVANDIKMLVIACNTISATCKDILKERYPDLPIIDVISPMAERVANDFADDSIGVIATKVTVGSGAYEKQINDLSPDTKVNSMACPLFVPMIEEGVRDNKILNPTIKFYLDNFLWDNKVDSLILGCTHYPIIESNIRQLYPSLKVLNPSKETVKKIRSYLEEHDMKAARPPYENMYFASDMSDSFINMIENIDPSSRARFKKFSGTV